jgi:hypothetical protein
MSKHTAGPWKQLNGTSPTIIDAEKLRVCEMVWSASKYDDNSEMMYANARLIAAAPDLLNTLERLQWAGLQKWPSDGMYHHVCPECERSPGEGHKEDCPIGIVMKNATGEA